MDQCARRPHIFAIPFWKEGTWGFPIFSFFSSGISVILILMCGIAVSSSLAVYGFSSFWLTVFGKRRSFMVLRYHLFSLSCLMQVNTMCSKYRGRGLSALTSPLFPRSLTLVPRSFLLNRTETLATQANKS